MLKPKPNTIPVKAIPAWLKGSREGQEFLQAAVEKRCLVCGAVRDAETKCVECGRRPTVLVVCGTTRDGKAWFEVYAEYKVHVVVRQQLSTPAAGEALAEELLSLRLPWSCAELYEPDNLRATHTILPRTVADEAAAAATAGLIREALKNSNNPR